ncbi:HAMP domain-containing histidine kinase (plasmid) [Bacillus cereus]|uniref:HAMP domain-containing sensor histidine kinase n=1 Tax=Bacillus TaxID=1386 RepID=UPI001F212F01|nr:HAMP domain-containing sensor histidine kinase [Bacillus cereus]UIJ69794.1 HAMP domain-containing histidine kinase [Bacillus cereus]
MRMFDFQTKLMVKLIIAVAISIVITFGVTILSFLSLLSINSPSFFLNITSLFSVVIVTFISILWLIVRRKLLYLKSITKSVHDIANGKLGLTIRIESRDELAHLAKNINYMSKELTNKFEYERKLETIKNELITNISHDLRTPLTSIIGYLDLLKKGKYNTETQLQEYIETIYSKSQRLKYSIDELFEYTRLSSPDTKLHLNKVDLSVLLEQLVGEYTPIFEKEGLSVKKSITNENIPIVMDIEKMVRVYENLFINAIKYSVKPSELSIYLECVGNKAILKISNTAERPLVNDVNQLFERFFMGDQARINERGTGIGLAISKRIVDLHNGSIYAKYKDGRITFVIEQPRNI